MKLKLEKYFINIFCNLKKDFIRLYIKYYTESNQHVQTDKKLVKKILLVDNRFLKPKCKY